MERQRGDYVVSDDKTKLDVNIITRYLAEDSYWAQGRPLATVERCIAHSAVCVGLYHALAGQVGFARVVSDLATFAWLADVFVLPEHRGAGLGKWLVECVVEHPELQGLRRFLLATRDAHGLYRQYGFSSLPEPERFMQRLSG